jgi:hypothetical protein
LFRLSDFSKSRAISPYHNREKGKELVFSTIAKDLLESKKGLLLLLVVQGKVGVDCKEKLSIWGGLNIKRDIDV